MKIDFKPILTLILLQQLLISCINKTDSRLEKAAPTNSKTAGGFISGKTLNSMQCRGLPLGPPVLKNYNFPKDGWNNNTYYDIPDSEKTNKDKNSEEYEKKFNEINFGDLSQTKIFPSPSFEHVNYINILYDSLTVNREIYLKEGFRFRLPDFGPYQCYYQDYTGPKLKLVTSKKTPVKYDAVSNLVFVDPKTQTANILNIYSSYYLTEDIDHEWRFFYINKDKTIEIFNAGSDEEVTYVNKVLTINIQNNGKIIIRNIK